MRTVGILGGMGPEATVLLMQRVLRAVPAEDDADHIPLIVHQNPAVPSRIKRLIEGIGEDPGPVLAKMVKDLEQAGAEALAMPCNTAHAYAPTIRAASPLPFLDMRQATVDRLPKGRIGVLASPAVRLTGAFDAHFGKAGLTMVWPENDSHVLSLIRQIKAGRLTKSTWSDFGLIAKQLARHCDHLLVACTELSLLTDALPKGTWTDSLDCLVSDIVAFAKGAQA